MNIVLLVLISAAVLATAWNGQMEALTQEIFASARTAVDIAFRLIGPMVLFLGLIQILRDAGAVAAMARQLAPIMRRLFPDVPEDHPAMGAMIMNVAANVFGLGNAATPFGLKAMQELDRLNPHPGVATNAMVLFLAINTSGVAVFPTGVIALRAIQGSSDPGGIFIPTVLATLTSTVVGVGIAMLLAKRAAFSAERHAGFQKDGEVGPSTLASGVREVDPEELLGGADRTAPRWRKLLAGIVGLLLLTGAVHEYGILVHRVDMCGAILHEPLTLPASGTLSGGKAQAAGTRQADTREASATSAVEADLSNRERASFRPFTPGEFLTKVLMSQWLIPLFVVFVVLFGWTRQVKIYESAIQGAREGFQIFVLIIPFLVLILVTVGLFRASGALDFVIGLLQPMTGLIGFPAEALPMALVRPLSGSGAQGVLVATMNTYGPDSPAGYLVSVMSGSTETTFYVLAVYFGSVGIRAGRHALIACLAADAAGMLAALFWCRMFLF